MDLFLTLTFCVFIFQEDKDNYNVTSLSNTTVSYHVDVSISCCTCPVGIMGGHCKHQSAVARMFGHNNGLFQCFSPETRQLYYQIATGEFMEISRGKQMSENIQPLFIFPLTGKDLPDDGSKRLPTAVLKKTSQPETTTPICTSEMFCVPDAGKLLLRKLTSLAMFQFRPFSVRSSQTSSTSVPLIPPCVFWFYAVLPLEGNTRCQVLFDFSPYLNAFVVFFIDFCDGYTSSSSQESEQNSILCRV